MDYRDRICALIKKYGYKKIVEVGVWRGDLSRKIVKECKDVNHMIMVDPLNEYLNNFDDYVCTMGESHKNQEDLDLIADELMELQPPFHFIREASRNAVKRIKYRSVAFVFIDAIHKYDNVREDIEKWMPKIKNGGCICGDDYTGHPKYSDDVKLAVDEVLGRRNIIVDGRLWYYFIETDEEPSDEIFIEPDIKPDIDAEPDIFSDVDLADFG